MKVVFFDRLKADPVYNTRAVVQRTGIPADTFRAWERRYGLPSPCRTPGNQRLYSERDVATITWLRDRTREGMTISQAVHLFQQEQGEYLNRSGQLSVAGANGNQFSIPHDDTDEILPSSFKDAVTEALIQFDATLAERIVEEALALAGVESVCEQLLQPVLHEIGDRWGRGEVSISAEHYASHFVLRKIGTLFNLSGPEEGRGPLVAACLEGELHEVGLLLTSLFLSRHGYSVVYLGANLPLRELLSTAQQVEPAMILMSTSTDLGVRRLAAASAKLVEACPDHANDEDRAIVGFGGQIFVTHPHLKERVCGVFLGAGAGEAVATVDALLGAPTRGRLRRPRWGMGRP